MNDEPLIKVVALLAVFAVSIPAQTGTSVISGIVKDATGSPVPNVIITIVNVASGMQVGTLSNEDGLYRAGTLLPGSYRLDVDAVGFDHLTRGPITLEVSQRLQSI